MNSLHKLLLALGVGALAVMALVGHLIWSGYSEVIYAAEARTSDYAEILEARLDATLRRANAVLQRLPHTIPLAALDQQAVPRYARELDAALDLEIINFTELAGVRVADASGNILYTSDSANTPRVQITDRSYFRAVRDNPQSSLVFSEVITARTTGRQSVALARPLRDGQGAFRGIVYVLLELDHFQKLFQSLDVGAGGVVSIYRNDNFTQVLRQPPVEGKLNLPLPPDSQIRKTLTPGDKTATFEVTSATDGRVRIYSRRTLHPYPFFVAVGVARDEVLASWRTRSLVTGLSTLLLVVLLTGLLFRLRRADADRAGLAAIVDASSDAIVSRDLEGKILTWNQGAERLFGYSAAEVTGRHIAVIVPQVRRDELRNSVALPTYPARTHDTVRVAKDGRLIDVSISASPIKDTAGSVAAIALIFRDISQRKQSEEARSLLVAAVEGSNDAIFIRDVKARIVYWNDAAQRLYGYTPAEVMGKDSAFLVPPELLEERRRNWERLQQGMAVANYETVRLCKDGSRRAVSASVSLVKNVGGTIIGMTTIARDITERKQAEAVRNQLAAIVENSNDAIFTRDLDGTILSWNAGAEKMLGYTAAEAIGKTTALIRSPGRPPDRIKNNERVSRGEVVVRESDHITRDGRVIDVLSSHSPIRDAAGNIVGVSLILQDISALRQAQAAMKESEARFRATFEQAAVGIAHFDLQERNIKVNRRYCEIVGYTQEELLGKSPRFLNHPDDRGIAGEQRSQLRAGAIDHFAQDKRYLHKDGTVIWVTRTESLVRDDAGAPQYYIRVIEDITARKQAEAARASLESQLRESQKMQAIGTLAGGIAHDFNNIIATILGNVELARQDTANNSPALESLEQIRKAGSRARDLVQQILTFSRRQPAHLKPTALAPVVMETARLLRATLPARLTLDVHCAPDMPIVLADATQIQQALLNLATNALQAIPGGPGRIRIQLDTVLLDAALAHGTPALLDLHQKHPGRTLRLTLSDTGAGMDAPTLERIFEPFFTTKPVGKGTGLGLSVVHGIVQTHQGAITVDSALGKGTTFTLYLPAAAALVDAAVPDQEGVAATPAPRVDGGAQVLYIDDDADLVYLVKRLLERRGYRVADYTQVHKALAALRAAPAAFDLVLTDYNMPGMSGLDVAREVREIRADLPVAVTSGFIDETLQAQAAAAGVRELIFKADSVEVFCDTVQRLVEKGGRMKDILKNEG